MFNDSLIFRFKERKYDINDLLFITKFFKSNATQLCNFNRIILNSSFKFISFDKERTLLFFIIFELLSLRSGLFINSKRIVLKFNIRKDTIVGCKVTLRKNNFYDFLDRIIIYMPRTENKFLISKDIVKKNTFNFIYLQLTDLSKFYELHFVNDETLKLIDLVFLFNSYFVEEKIFVTTLNNIYLQINK